VLEKDVLIVEDEAALGEMLAGILRKNGYVVDLAVTAAGARKLLDEYRYGVMLADWRLPDGDGVLIANLAAEVGTYSFVMSGYLPHMLPGSVDIRHTLTKPVRPDELLATVRVCIGKAAGTAADT
jgi:two-component system, NtrC family, response regulator HydG